MQTIIFLTIIFLIVIFSVLLYFKQKSSRLDTLNSGVCPDCGSKEKIILDTENDTQFKVQVIKKRVLQNHGCSGAVDIEYKCSECGLKEVHSCGR